MYLIGILNESRDGAGNWFLCVLFLLSMFALPLAVGTTAAADIPGDFNQNGSVDAADYVVWRKNPGGVYTPEDYTTWRANFSNHECSPMFVRQPQSQTVGIGSDVTFSVEITGAEPFAYQWDKNQVPIPGATYASFSIFNVQLSDAGNFDVTCFNSCGVAVSDTASLTVVLEGDYNNNGVVDAADYVVWRKNEGATNPLSNDLIGGTIGSAQYDQWRANFGQTTGSGVGARSNAVPEPTTAVLLILATGICLCGALKH